MDARVKYWLDLADYDFETAKAMLKTKRFLYVGFMCHQSIEKSFKAYYTFKTNETAPFTHSISTIAKKGNFYDELTELQKDNIDIIEPLNIETRYPSYKERLLKSLTNERCKEFIIVTEEFLLWIKTQLSIP